MGGRRVAILFLTLLFTSLTTQNDSDDGASAAIVEERDRISQAVNEFGYKLMLKMMTTDVDKNIVVSPTGISGLLAMTLLGSAGATYDELAKALGFSQGILENRKYHEQFGNLLQELNTHNVTDLNTISDATSESIDANATTTAAPEKVDAKSTANAAPEKATATPEKVDAKASSTAAPEKVDANATSDATPKSDDANATSVSTADANDTIDASSANLTRTLYADAIVVDADTRIRDVYRDYLERVYHGDAFTADFRDGIKAQELINNWVQQHTGGKISDFLLEPPAESTRVVLLSALYFSGQWARPFVPEFTNVMPFHRPAGKVNAELMLNLGEFNYTFKAKHGVHLLSIPYNDSTTTMYIMKPINKKTSLLSAMEKLDYRTIDQLIDTMTEEECVLRFPKMDLKTKVDLKNALKELGVKSIFSPKDANFALMVDVPSKNEDGGLLTRVYTGNEEKKKLKDAVDALPNPGIYVDSVLHDVKMTINEYGTTAVAATGGLLSRSARLFYADSPFYMFIRNEKTKLVTFSAVIFDPTAAS